MKLKISDIAHHRNGICGIPFAVVLFTDTGPEGSRKIAILFEHEGYCAVLDVDKLAQGDIAFGKNSWRGDRFEKPLRDAIRVFSTQAKGADSLMTQTETIQPATPYTPDPWDYDMDYIIAPDPDGRHPDIYIAEIAHSDDEGRIASPPQQDANRRLIAAAPEQLEALDYLLEQTVDMDLKYGIGLSEGEQEARKKALAAIAKATSNDCDGR
jgi:hypothetical protein